MASTTSGKRCRHWPAASGTSTLPLLGETIGDNLRRRGRGAPGTRRHPCRAPQGCATRTPSLDRAVDDLVAGLIDAGLAVGDRLGIWSPNRAEWVVLQYAMARAGIILVGLNPRITCTSELEYAVRQSGRWMVVAIGEFKGGDFCAMLAEIRPGTAGVGTGRAVRLRRVAAGSCRLANGGNRRRARPLRSRCKATTRSTSSTRSGTTGFPKGATLTHHSILNNGFFIGERCRYSPADRVCIPVPFYHCFGMVLGNLGRSTHGACMVGAAPSVRSRRIIAGGARRALHGALRRADDVHRRAGPRLTSSATTCRRLRTGIMAGSPCPVEVMKQVRQPHAHGRGDDLLRMTETSPVFTQTTAEDTLERPRLDGRHASIRTWRCVIIDPVTGRDGRRGETGRALHPRLLGDVGLLEGPGADGRGDRRRAAGCTPATSP